MPRHGKVIKRILKPDAQYNSMNVARLIQRVMLDGRKATAEGIVYSALSIIEKKEKRDAIEVLEQAIKNITPILEVKPRRVGGATYQVPIEVRPDRSKTLTMRWLVNATRARSGRTMAEKLAAEVTDAFKEQGTAVKKREDTHRMAEANRAFAHYRW